MLADYNKNPFDTKAAKMTFDDVYVEWSKRKYPTVSESNVKGYTAAYKTCISMLAEADVDQTIIKKIVGHSGAMTLTEKVYTHFDVKKLVNEINKI